VSRGVLKGHLRGEHNLTEDSKVVARARGSCHLPDIRWGEEVCAECGQGKEALRQSERA
jgi:hypothetical protein